MVNKFTIGNRIEYVMNEVNMNYRTFGKQIGFSDVVVGNIIKGRNKPSYDFIISLLQTYDWINPFWLLLGKGKMNRESLSLNIVEEEKAPYHQLPPGPCQQCLLRDDIIASQKKTIEALEQLLQKNKK